MVAATDILIRGGGGAGAAEAAVAKTYVLRLLAMPCAEVSWTRTDFFVGFVLRNFAKSLSTKEYNIILRAVTRGTCRIPASEGEREKREREERERGSEREERERGREKREREGEREGEGEGERERERERANQTEPGWGVRGSHRVSFAAAVVLQAVYL